MTDPELADTWDAVHRAWDETQQRLPGGWVLDSIRCASTSLDPDDRSEDWIAVATGPQGSREARAFGPIEALRLLADGFAGH